MGPPTQSAAPGLSHARSASLSGYANLDVAAAGSSSLPVSTGPFELRSFRQQELVLGPGEERTPRNSVGRVGRGGVAGGSRSGSDGGGGGRMRAWSERTEVGGLLRPVGCGAVGVIREEGGEGGERW